MKFVKCINNLNWFGTLGKIYKVNGVKFISVKDDRFVGELAIKLYEVVDDFGVLVSVPSDDFVFVD